MCLEVKTNLCYSFQTIYIAKGKSGVILEDVLKLDLKINGSNDVEILKTFHNMDEFSTLFGRVIDDQVVALTLNFGSSDVEVFVSAEGLKTYINDTRFEGLKEDNLVKIDANDNFFNFISNEGLTSLFSCI